MNCRRRTKIVWGRLRTPGQVWITAPAVAPESLTSTQAQSRRGVWFGSMLALGVLASSIGWMYFTPPALTGISEDAERQLQGKVPSFVLDHATLDDAVEK